MLLIRKYVKNNWHVRRTNKLQHDNIAMHQNHNQKNRKSCSICKKKNVQQIAYHVSKLLNFFVTTFPKSIPNRSTIRCAKSGCDDPENTLIFGILDCNFKTLDFSKLSRTKLLARIGLADRTGITQSTTPAIRCYFLVN